MQSPWSAYECEAAACDISRTAIDKEAKNPREGEQSEKYFSLVCADRDKPAPCIQASHGNRTTASVLHPVERRKFTINEVKAICSFPPDFILCGKYAQQWERLGNSVPPLMMRAIASEIRDKILLPLKAKNDG